MSVRDLRTNHQIRARQVRVISENGEQLGIMEVRAAQSLAQQRGLDLVEVAPDASPPVCRILNYGKYKYTLRKKEKEAARKQRIVRLKEVKIRPKIDEHDYLTKLRRAWEFLAHGDKVKFSLFFRGREMSHQEIGHQLMQRIVEDLQEIAEAEAPPRQEGNQITVMFNPRPAKPAATPATPATGSQEG